MKSELKRRRNTRTKLVAGALAVMCFLGGMSSTVVASGPRVDVNRAGVEALAALPGIGESKAQAIVAERAKKPFASVDELVRVRGIGAATLDGLREKISASQKN
jgi:competence protein ComEA